MSDPGVLTSVVGPVLRRSAVRDWLFLSCALPEGLKVDSFLGSREVTAFKMLLIAMEFDSGSLDVCGIEASLYCAQFLLQDVDLFLQFTSGFVNQAVEIQGKY
ncbi:hypothetical protein GCM10027398_35930 [Azotobacter salinestris]